MEPFKPLLSPKTPFTWTDELESAFQRSKDELIDAIKHGVHIFDPNRKTSINPDWSRTGIGYWLRQKYCSCESEVPDCCATGWKITLAGSRFLRAGEKRYAPIEGEALAIAWALEDTKYFTLGCDNLIVSTDHKPLIKIFGDRSLDEISNTRIFRLKKRTLAWRFKVVHVPGKNIPASDATSRNPASSSECASSEWLSSIQNISDTMEDDIIATVHSSLDKIRAVTWDRVKEATRCDPYLQQLQHHIINAFPSSSVDLPIQLHPYWKYRNDLSIVDDDILVGNRIVIPPPLRAQICTILHSAHQGTTAMTERAKEAVFWPGISSCINQTREQCNTCWRMAPSQPNLPPADPFIPSYPFEAIAADYCDLEGHHYLITVDRFSNWPEIIKVSSGSTNSGSIGLIKALKKCFATFGVPEELSSDNGPEFIAKDTEDFLHRWGVRHRRSSAYNPRSNGRAEAAVKSMKRLLTDNISTSGDIYSDSFTQAILQFRNTPDPGNGISPSETIFGRPLRDSLPVKPKSQIFDNTNVRPLWRDLWNKREDLLRTRFASQVETLNTKTRDLPSLQVGDVCRLQNQTGRFPKKWDRTGHVVQANKNDQYVVKVNGSGRLTLRNRRYLRKIQPVTAFSVLSQPTCRPNLSTIPVIPVPPPSVTQEIP